MILTRLSMIKVQKYKTKSSKSIFLITNDPRIEINNTTMSIMA